VAGPGDEIAAAEGRGRSDLRASHADREQATKQLKVAFVQGRLDKDEFDARVGQALTGRTYTELAAVTAGLPAAPTAARPPEPADVQGETRVLRPGAVLAAATAIYAGTWLLAFFLPRTSEGDPMAGANLVVAATFAYSVVLVFAVGRILTGWQDRRSGGQLPGDQHLARAARHPSARQRPARADSSRRPATVTSTSPKRIEAILPMRDRPARGQHINGAIADLASRLVVPAIDVVAARRANGGPFTAAGHRGVREGLTCVVTESTRRSAGTTIGANRSKGGTWTSPSLASWSGARPPAADTPPLPPNTRSSRRGDSRRVGSGVTLPCITLVGRRRDGRAGR
jgi:Domain of unknown function (DUF1707)